jgi:hypothetical protein
MRRRYEELHVIFGDDTKIYFNPRLCQECSFGIMATITSHGGDPFIDSITEESDQANAAVLTLTVGKNASLSLATDSLIVLGELRLQ